MRLRSAIPGGLLLAVTTLSCAAAMEAQDPGFRLNSRDLDEGAFRIEQVYKGLGCVGQNISPDIEWSNVPAGTKSFVLTIYDPDAPTGSGWWHWVVVNIPGNANGISGGASGNASKMPSGSLETRTDFGTPGYGGPCPPERDSPHRYIVSLFALKVDKLDVTADSSAAMVGMLAQSNSLAKTTMTATYGR